MNKTQHTRKVINLIRQETNEVLLYYSGGKDSLALLDMLSKKFDRVVCVFLYLVPDLEHVQPHLDWVTKRYKNTELHQKEHYLVNSIARGGVFTKKDLSYPKKKRIDMDKELQEEFGIFRIMSGEKGFDGFMKRMVHKKLKLNAISDKGIVYPLSLWTNNEVFAYIKHFNLIAPIAYNPKKASQGVGFDVNVYVWLRENYPNDLAKILQKYPLSEKILYDYDREVQAEQDNPA